MRNIIRSTLFLFICLFTTSPLFAYISGKTKINEKLVYCPEQVYCSETGNQKSCKYSGEESPYWNYTGGSGDPDGLIKGEYKLVNVAGRYHWPAGGSVSTCIYENTETGVSKTIAVYAKVESNLEAFYDKSTKWIISDKGYPFPSYCRSSSPRLCPLTEQSALGILNNNDEKIYINGISRNPKYMSVIRYEDELGNCGGSKECEIYIGIDPIGYIGNVTVDMDNKLKILKIIQPPRSLGIEFKQLTFNTIEVKKLDMTPVVPKVNIYNSINSAVAIIINGNNVTKKDIEPRSDKDVFFDLILPACRNNRECKLEIIISGGGYGVVGSVTVDMDNNMNILRTVSQRDSEIVINQISPNSVEVKYPSFN